MDDLRGVYDDYEEAEEKVENEAKSFLKYWIKSIWNTFAHIVGILLVLFIFGFFLFGGPACFVPDKWVNVTATISSYVSFGIIILLLLITVFCGNDDAV